VSKEEQRVEDARRRDDLIKLTRTLGAQSHKDSRSASATFAHFAKTVANARAFTEALKWLDSNPRPNLIVDGPVGCGKTFLARCLFHELIAREVPAMWLSVPELVEEARRGFKEREVAWAAQQRRQLARTAPVLFLDDLGKNAPGEGGWLEETLYSIVDPRYRFELPTVFTTEFQGSTLKQRVGDSVVSRLASGAVRAPIAAPDEPYRRPAEREGE